MSHSVSRILLTAIVFAAAGVYAEPPRCSATARECDQQIRSKLSGRRYSGLVITEKNPGLVIKAVAEESPAWNAGLQPGDRLIAANDKSLTQASAREFKQILADARESGRVALIIWRRGAYSRVEFRLEPYTKDQIEKIITAHLAQSHPSTAGAQ
jgi:predicted metalloprotease with PDZ domain